MVEMLKPKSVTMSNRVSRTTPEKSVKATRGWKPACSFHDAAPVGTLLSREGHTDA